MGSSRRLFVAASLFVGLLAVSGCTDRIPAPSSATTGTFSGPWSEELAYYDAATDSTFAHQALADSVISDAEVEEGRGLIAQCYRDRGAEVTYDAYGYATVTVVTGSEDPMAVMGACEFADGGIVVLYGQIQLNPDHLDPSTIQAACMVEHGIVEPGLTARDLEHYLQVESAVAPWAPSDQDVATTCMVDPLGLASGVSFDAPTPAGSP